ncbi:MAG: methylated-DNA--[protein]-cysteine S-methyltransferase [Candidatus Krumholzibacteriota bacterium]|nr:methylated-DNA--[protein]-cysteine S-methyltransferase [Candidatus Krumholzibacteriota bacterium]
MHSKIIKHTPFGPVGIIWTALNGDPKIVRILLSTPGLPAEKRVHALYPNTRHSSCEELEDVASGIKSLLEGENIKFSLDIVDLNRCSSFQRQVLRAEHRIPRGRISTYRLIAICLGKLNGARAVGNALANNPFPLIVPCHRAVRSDRHPGGYQGGAEMKRALLEREGITFDEDGRVTCAFFDYR